MTNTSRRSQATEPVELVERWGKKLLGIQRGGSIFSFGMTISRSICGMKYGAIFASGLSDTVKDFSLSEMVHHLVTRQKAPCEDQASDEKITLVTEPTCRYCGSHDIETSGPDHMPLYCNDCNSEAVDFPPVKQAPREDQARGEKTVPVKPGEKVDFDTFPEEESADDSSDPGNYDPEIHDGVPDEGKKPSQRYTYSFRVGLGMGHNSEAVATLLEYFRDMQMATIVTEKEFNIFRTGISTEGFVLKDITRVPHQNPETVR